MERVMQGRANALWKATADSDVPGEDGGPAAVAGLAERLSRVAGLKSQRCQCVDARARGACVCAPACARARGIRVEAAHCVGVA